MADRSFLPVSHGKLEEFIGAAHSSGESWPGLRIIAATLMPSGRVTVGKLIKHVPINFAQRDRHRRRERGFILSDRSQQANRRRCSGLLTTDASRTHDEARLDARRSFQTLPDRYRPSIFNRRVSCHSIVLKRVSKLFRVRCRWNLIDFQGNCEISRFREFGNFLFRKIIGSEKSFCTTHSGSTTF